MVDMASSDASRALVDRDWRMLIAGELVTAAGKSLADVVDPSSGRVIARIPDGGAEDVDAAAAAAKAAFPSWSRRSILERAEMVTTLADAIEAHGDELAMLDTLDNGSPISVMRNDYKLAVDHLRFFAGLALQLKGETVPVAELDALDFTLRHPFGVV